MYNVNSSLYPESLKEKAKGLIVSTDNKDALVNPKAMLKNIVTRSINPQQKLLNIMLQITGATITIVSLMWFGLNSQTARLNNLMITMDNQLVIMSSLDTQVLKRINTIVVAMYLAIMTLKMPFIKRTLQCPPVIGVKVALIMVGACKCNV